MKPILPFILLIFFSACSSGNGQPDAGADAQDDTGGDDGVDAGDEPVVDAGDEPVVDAGDEPVVDAGDESVVDAGDGSDAADGGDPGDVDNRPDYDPAQSFLLIVPDDTSLCFGFCEDRNWRQALAMTGRIDMLPGYYILPRQEGFFPTELVEKIIFGPERNEPQPDPHAGEIEAKYSSGGDGRWQYTFRKGFSLQNQPYHLEVNFQIRYDGTGWPAEVVVGSGSYFFETTAMLRIGPGLDFIDEVQAFGLCDLPERSLYTATTAGDNQIVLDVREGPYMTSCLADGETSCLFLTGAQVQIGAFQQSISDRFRLVYVGSHHNWLDEYLILLDPPAGNTHAVLVDAPDIMGSTPYLIQMDANFNEVGRDEITDWQEN